MPPPLNALFTCECEVLALFALLWLRMRDTPQRIMDTRGVSVERVDKLLIYHPRWLRGRHDGSASTLSQLMPLVKTT